jgi:hypothetical protein
MVPQDSKTATKKAERPKPFRLGDCPVSFFLSAIYLLVARAGGIEAAATSVAGTSPGFRVVMKSG